MSSFLKYFLIVFCLLLTGQAESGNEAAGVSLDKCSEICDKPRWNCKRSCRDDDTECEVNCTALFEECTSNCKSEYGLPSDGSGSPVINRVLRQLFLGNGTTPDAHSLLVDVVTAESGSSGYMSSSVRELSGQRVKHSHLIGDKCGKVPILQQKRSYPQISSNIFNGQDSQMAGHWPWLVSFQLQGVGHLCGGAIIAPNWILTAAHCVNEEFLSILEFLEIVAGDYDLSDTEGHEVIVRIKTVHIHPNYSRTSKPFYMTYDVALLELKEELVYDDYIQPACLPPSAHFNYSECFQTGWGVRNDSATSAGGILQVSPFTFVDIDHCSSHFNRTWLASTTTMCTRSISGTSKTCKGDSGAPLSCLHDNAYFVAGVVSFSKKGCDEKVAPLSGFTNISMVADWISTTCGDCA